MSQAINHQWINEFRKICLTLARLHRMPMSLRRNYSPEKSTTPYLFTMFEQYFDTIPAESYAREPERQRLYDLYFAGNGEWGF